MTTYKKEVIKNIQAHILSYMTKEELKANIKAVKDNKKESDYHAIVKLVEGGCFLVYYYEIREFLKELLNQTEQESLKYSDEQVWNLYKHLLARDGEKLLK